MCIDIKLINWNLRRGYYISHFNSQHLSFGNDVDCWDTFRWNVLSQTYAAQSSWRATYTIHCHTHHTISQTQCGHITLIGYIPLKYYTYSLQQFHSPHNIGKIFKVYLLLCTCTCNHCYTLVITEITDVFSAYDFHKYKFPVCTF